MAKNNAKENHEALRALNAAIKSGEVKGAYAFFGEEQYLLQSTLVRIRKLLIQEGFEAFNHRVISGKSFDMNDLQDALEAYPAFGEYTLTEVDDLALGSLSNEDKEKLIALLQDLPEYAVLILKFTTEEYKLDGRLKTDAQLKKLITPVEFKQQPGDQLARWIMSHVKANGCSIDANDAEYFAFYTGGLMANLNNEIDKVCFGCQDNRVTRADIERMVPPSLDAAVYHLTDDVLRRDYRAALRTLSTLYDLENEPRMIFAVLTGSIRQLYYTRLALRQHRGANEIAAALGLKYSFQADKLIAGARKMGDKWCQGALELAVETAYTYNSASGLDDAQVLTDLLLKLAVLS